MQYVEKKLTINCMHLFLFIGEILQHSVPVVNASDFFHGLLYIDIDKPIKNIIDHKS